MNHCRQPAREGRRRPATSAAMPKASYWKAASPARPLLITAGKDARRVGRPPRPAAVAAEEGAHPWGSQTAPKVRIEGLFGVYAFSGGPYAAVILESEPLLKRDKSTQVFADAKLRWPRDACHAFRLRRATKVAVVPVSNANRRLSKRQAQDEALCLRLLESALRKRPWVFSRDSDAATLTRASDARDYALAERQALRQGARQGRGRGAAALRAGGRGLLWNQRVLAPVVSGGVGIMSRRRRGAPSARACDAESANGAWREQSHRETADTHTQRSKKQRRSRPAAAALVLRLRVYRRDGLRPGEVDDAEDEGPAPCAVIVLTRLGVDTGARLVRRGLGRMRSLSSYAETRSWSWRPRRIGPRGPTPLLFEGITTVALEDDAPSQTRGPAQAPLDIEKGPVAATGAGQREARETDARKLDGAVEQLLQGRRPRK